MDKEFKGEVYKLLRYVRCLEMATGYKGQDRPNLDYISRKMSEINA